MQTIRVKNMVKISTILLLYISSMQSFANTTFEKCGEAKISMYKKHKVISNIQVNWGQSRSCELTSFDNEGHNVEFRYQYLRIENIPRFLENEEKAISKFYAIEQNKYELPMYKVILGKDELHCFNVRVNEDENGFNAKCFYFKNQSKREIKIDRVKREFKEVSKIIKEILLD